MSALELLERGGARIDRELADQPRIRVRVERTIGRAYRQLGLYDQALDHLRDAAAVAAAEEPPDLRAELRRGAPPICEAQ